MKLFQIRVAIYEPAQPSYPIVVQQFLGRTPEEAGRYHHAHRKADAFLRGCEDHGLYLTNVPCRAVQTEGWIEA